MRIRKTTKVLVYSKSFKDIKIVIIMRIDHFEVESLFQLGFRPCLSHSSLFSFSNWFNVSAKLNIESLICSNKSLKGTSHGVDS